MLFTSFEFLAFLLVVFIIYYTLPKKFQWIVLLIASYLFYAQNGVELIAFLLSTTFSTYIATMGIDKLYQQQEANLTQYKEQWDRKEKRSYKEKIKKKQRKYFILCLVFNFGVLGVFKYTNFVIANINTLMGVFNQTKQLQFVNLLLPMGISFYIFQTMGYLIDVYRGTSKAEKNPFKLGLFVSFFPQLIQGPISRFNDVKDSLFGEHSLDYHNIYFGFQRVLFGFFKKLVIADRLLPAVNQLIKDPITYQGAYVLVGMVFYAIQLLADFTGGIDITIGIAEMLGIKLVENFDRPFLSKNITEYWRRWHITMGTWFKDYLFYPISVSKPMRKFSKFSRSKFGKHYGKRIPVYISTMVLWFLTGLWHGASWNFIMWGVMNGLIILISQEFTPFYEWFNKKFTISNTLLFNIFRIVRTFLLMCSLRLFDCYRDVGTAIKMFFSMFRVGNYHILFDGSMLQIGLQKSDYIVLVVSVFLLWGVSMLQSKGSVREQTARRSKGVQIAIIYLLFMSIIILGAYGIGYDSSQFIYNQF